MHLIVLTRLFWPWDFKCYYLNYFGRNVRSNLPEVLCKKGVLRNFIKFRGKHLCQSLLFNKVADLRPATLLKKKLWHRCFPVNFVNFLRIPFLTEHLRWLILCIASMLLNTNLSITLSTFLFAHMQALN